MNPNESQACPVCNFLCNIKNDYLHWGWPDIEIFDKLKILSCVECGFSFLQTEIPDLRLNEFYNHQYRGVGSPFYFNYNQIYGVPRTLPIRATSQIYLASIFTKFLPGDVFLDIGAGPGDSLFCARHILSQPKLLVIEPNQESQDYYTHNFGAITLASLTDMCAVNLKAQIILLSHSLEHFSHSYLPTLFQSIKSVLTPNGVVVIEVPNVDFRVHKNMRFPDTPHTIFFSRDSLCRLLIKFGFEIKYVQILGDAYPYDHLPPVLTRPRSSVKKSLTYRQQLRKLLTKMHLISFFISLKQIFLYKKSKKMDLDSFNDFKNDPDNSCIRVVAILRPAGDL